MKVVKYKSDTTGMSPDDLQSIELVPQNKVKGFFDKFRLWAEFDLPANFAHKNKIARERYEWFVAGFIYFYDAEIRNNTVDHSLYFDWTTDKKKVKILIKPPAKKNPKLKNSTTGGTTDPPTPPPPPPPPMS